jgi:V/A-type H+/Na+-transporting ATPase subunit I
MAVEKMRFINITGRIKQMDAFIINAILPFDIHLENAMCIFDTVKGVYSFTDANPYEKLMKKSAELISVLEQEMKYDPLRKSELIPLEILEREIDGFERQIETIRKILKSLQVDLFHKKEIRKQVMPFQNIDYPLDEMFHVDYIKFRFGKMPKDSFKKLDTYLETLDVIAYKVSEDEEKVYLIYFTPMSKQSNIDSLFASLFFERIRLFDEIKGNAKETLIKINEEITELESRIEMLKTDLSEFIQRNYDRLQDLYNNIILLTEIHQVRRYALRSEDAFYLTGWIPNSQVNLFKKTLEGFEAVSYVIEADDEVKKSTPPTLLVNNNFFKPFEELVTMYGTPSYKELDPTKFVGITYLLFFGLMFGDLGQGFLIASIFFLLYRKSKAPLLKIGIYLGLTSMVTGVFYGSVFGNEEILRELLPFIPMINPTEQKIPILLVTIVLGVILLIIAMIFGIINSYKKEQFGKMLFDRNGIAGLILYFIIIGLIISFIFKSNPSPMVIVLLITIPLVVLFFAHPLENFFENRHHFFPDEKSGFFVEALFELIETLLAIVSNSISFMRIGAFALNHVGFFMAFHALSDIVGGAGSIFVIIFGNILVIVLEGLIVAIQGLRLEYYELFSRFYEGDGKEFIPFKIRG